jgi:tetrahydromethanopterin S-methyltransferase subunit G
MKTNEPLDLYERARKSARSAAAKHISEQLSVTLPNSVLGTAVDIAISTYNLEIGEAAEIGELLLHKPTPVEALAERLAKVEDRLARLVQPADNYGSILTRLDAIEGRQDEFEQRTVSALNTHGARVAAFGKELHGVNVGEADHNRKLHDRITQVAEIIGERVSGLVEEIAAVRDSAKRAHERMDEWGKHVDELDRRTFGSTLVGAFPTGGDSTAEAASDAVLPVPEKRDAFAIPEGHFAVRDAEGRATGDVLPVPQRGDRVRLEGAKTINGHPIKDGWYDVLGHGKEFPEFQIGLDHMRTPWVRNDSPGLKEVTRNAST